MAIYGFANKCFAHPVTRSSDTIRTRPEVPAMKNLGLALLVFGLLLVGCNAAPSDPTVAVRRYAPYDNFYGRRGGTPTD